MAKTRLAPIPRMEPGTYSGVKVLRFVQKLIKQEPKRLYMGNWETYFKGRFLANGIGEDEDNLPACGTVACAAGWINIATGHKAFNTVGGHLNPGERSLVYMKLADKKTSRSPYGFKEVELVNVAPAGLALDKLFGRTRWKPNRVVAGIDKIIHEHRKALSRARVVVK
jgi:hypothetical protein